VSTRVASLNDVMRAVTGQLTAQLASVLSGVQVCAELVYNPTPPSIDVYPADPFLTAEAVGAWSALFVIRARVTTADQQGGQELLLDLMDPRSETSLRAALAADATFGGVCDDSTVEAGPSGYIAYRDPGGGGDLLGCTWQLRVMLS
jgi:hypothetical protein